MSLLPLTEDLSLENAISLLRYRQAHREGAAYPGLPTSAPPGSGPDSVLSIGQERPATSPSGPSLGKQSKMSMMSRGKPSFLPRSPGRGEVLKPRRVIVDEPVPDKLADMLRRAADFERQSMEQSIGSKQSRLTQSCQSFRSLGSMASSRLTRAVSLRQQTSRVLAARGRQSPSASHGKYRIGQLSKLGSGIFHLPEIPGTPVEQSRDAKKVPKAKIKVRRHEGPQEVSLEAARAFWDLAAQEDRRAQPQAGGRHRSSQDGDGRRQASNSQSNRYPSSYVQLPWFSVYASIIFYTLIFWGP